jgi:hypothetical protein
MGERRLAYALYVYRPRNGHGSTAVEHSIVTSQALEKEMGERRLTFHRPCGISVLPKLDVDGIVGGTGARAAKSHIVAKSVQPWQS